MWHPLTGFLLNFRFRRNRTSWRIFPASFLQETRKFHRTRCIHIHKSAYFKRPRYTGNPVCSAPIKATAKYAIYFLNSTFRTSPWCAAISNIKDSVWQNFFGKFTVKKKSPVCQEKWTQGHCWLSFATSHLRLRYKKQHFRKCSFDFALLILQGRIAILYIRLNTCWPLHRKQGHMLSITAARYF